MSCPLADAYVRGEKDGAAAVEVDGEKPVVDANCRAEVKEAEKDAEECGGGSGEAVV